MLESDGAGFAVDMEDGRDLGVAGPDVALSAPVARTFEPGDGAIHKGRFLGRLEHQNPRFGKGFDPDHLSKLSG